MKATSAKPCVRSNARLSRRPTPNVARRHTGPSAEGPRKTLLVAKSHGQGYLFDEARRTPQLLERLFAPQFVLEPLHRTAFLVQLSVQRAAGDIQPRGEGFGVASVRCLRA